MAIITGSLLQESFGKGVLDSACTVTVSGFTWMEDYLNKLSPEQRELVSVQPSDSYINFGGGERVSAKKKYTIPIRFGDTSFLLIVLVIPGDLPLLISVGSMTKACFVIDFANKALYTTERFPIQLSMSTSGHLLLDFSFDRTVFASCLAMSQVVDDSQIEKLNKQFAHCSSGKLHTLLRKAGVSVTVDRVKSVINDCDVCQRFGRALPRTVVGLPLAQEWNHTVSLDLHEVSGSGRSLWYLHMIDVFSRLSVAVFITSKRPTTNITEFFRNWCLCLGYPQAVLTDNGGEFDNADFHSFAENADIVIKTTAAYSLWSNGVVERHNVVLTDMFNRIIFDDSLKYDRETALKTAVFAKNSMFNHDGFSPYQIAFGCGPRLPSIFTNQPPALECTTTSESVSKLLFKLNEARRFFIEADSSNRIKRALKSNVRYDNGPFVLGDRVFFKRESDDR